SFYAATKRSNELMAHVYSHLHRIPATGLRYFTVYGPWGRPDMSPALFAKSIMEGKPIEVFNGGDHQPVALLDYIRAMERALGKAAKLEMRPMQPGDVKATYADTSALAKAIGFAPATPLGEGLTRFAEWFRSYYGYQ